MAKTQRPLRAQQKRRLRAGSLSLAILSALATGAYRITASALLLAGSSAPTTRSIRRWQYKQLDQVFSQQIELEKILNDTKRKYRLSRSLQEIQRRRLVRVVTKNKKVRLVITEEGKRRVVPYLLDTLAIEPQTTWDGVWRIVLFDVPESRRYGRDALRKKLRDLGFFQLQKSAFVFPYPCADQLDSIILAFHITPHVTFFETTSLGYHEGRALAYFGLRRQKKR